MALIIWFMWESQVERVVSGFVPQTHVVLSLAGALVTTTVFITAVLPPSAFISLEFENLKSEVRLCQTYYS